MAMHHGAASRSEVTHEMLGPWTVWSFLFGLLAKIRTTSPLHTWVIRWLVHRHFVQQFACEARRLRQIATLGRPWVAEYFWHGHALWCPVPYADVRDPLHTLEDAMQDARQWRLDANQSSGETITRCRNVFTGQILVV